MERKNFFIKSLSLGFLAVLLLCAVNNVHMISAVTDDYVWQGKVHDTGEAVTSWTYQTHSVYSKRTELVYSFYYRLAPYGEFYYTAHDLFGNTVIDHSIIFDDIPVDMTPVSDFDVTIDDNGDRIYLIYPEVTGGKALGGYTNDEYWVFGYILVNEQTKDLDFVSSKQGNQVVAPALQSTTMRNPDVEILNDGTLVFTMGFRSGVSRGACVHWINSTTAWDTYDEYTLSDEICITETGFNPANDNQQMAVTPLDDTFALYWRSYDNGNAWLDRQYAFICTDLDFANNFGTPIGASWLARLGGTQDYLPNNYMYDFDLIGGRGYSNLTVVWSERDVGNTWTKTYEEHYNITSDVSRAKESIFGTMNQAIYIRPWLYRSEDFSETALVYANGTDTGQYHDEPVHIIRMNKTTESFEYSEEAILGDWNAVDYEDTAKGNDFAPSYGDMNIGLHTLEDSLDFGWFLMNVSAVLPIDYVLLDGVSSTSSEYGIMIEPLETHTVTARVHDNVTIFFAGFEDANYNIDMVYNLTSNIVSNVITPKSGNGTDIIAYLDGVTETDDGNFTILEMDFVFTNLCFDYYKQYMTYGGLFNGAWWNFTSSIKYSVFNLGDIPSYTTTEGSTLYTDNDLFSVGVTNDGNYTQFNVLYRKLTHMHFNVELDIDGDWDSTAGTWNNNTGGFFEYGFNYWLEGEYTIGHKVRIYPSSVVVGHQNAGVDLDYVQWTVEHYTYNYTLGDYQLEASEFLYSNFNGYDNENAIPDYHNMTSATWWFDMWFSNDNASRRVATRVNTEWFGMYEQGSPYWFGYGAFRPVQGEVHESIFYDNVTDTNDTIKTSYRNVDIVEFWGRVEKVSGGDKQYIMHNYLMKNKEIAQGEFIGIDTPALVETKVMDMPQTGFLAQLMKVLGDMRKFVYQGIADMLASLGVIVDSILVNLGLPPIMSILYNVIVGIYDIFALLYTSFLDMVDWIIESAQNVISGIFLVIPRYFVVVGLAVTTFVGYYNNIVLFFTGGFAGIPNLWVDFNLYEMLQFGFALIPVWEAVRIDKADNKLEALSNDVKMFVELVMGVFNLVGSIFRLFLDILSRIAGVF